MMRTPAIEVRGLRTAYGSHIVHDDLDLEVRSGEVMGVIGPSGTGKSVLLRAIIGLKRPEKGEVSVFGQDVLHGHKTTRKQKQCSVMDCAKNSIK